MVISPTLYTLDMILRSPKARPVSPYWNIVKPFSSLVWLCVALTAMLSALVFNMLYYILNKFGGMESKLSNESTMSVFKTIIGQSKYQ